jgi:hypothetical protein
VVLRRRNGGGRPGTGLAAEQLAGAPFRRRRRDTYRIEKTVSASDLRSVNLDRAFTESKNGFGLPDETIAFIIKDLVHFDAPQNRSVA